MTEENKKPIVEEPKDVKDAPVVSDAKETVKEPAKEPVKKEYPRSGGDKKRMPRKNFGRKRDFERAKPEFEQKIISIRRVTRVVSGGRRFSFSVSLVAGDKKGKVGVGIGKAADTSLAIEKAARNAKKNMVKIKRNQKMSIPHDLEVKLSTARLKMFPAPGRGIVAGSAIRTVLDLAGMKDVGAKILSRSKNKLNIARAAINALESIK